MKHYYESWIADWCGENGWTDWFVESSKYWAFPPNAVMPTPIPGPALRSIKADRGMTRQERYLMLSAFGSMVAGLALGYATNSPLPALAAFTYCAIVTASMEEEDF
jgi:hypothetical protein